MASFGQHAPGRDGPDRAAGGTARAAGGTAPVGTRTLAALTAAAPLSPAPSYRLGHHLLLLTTAGYARHTVDFVSYPCRPGTLLWVRPGQVVHFGTGAGADAVLVTWEPGFLPPLRAAGWAAVDDGFGPVCWQLAGEDEDAVIDEVSQLVVDCRRHDLDGLAVELLRHQLAALVLRVTLVPPVDLVPGPGCDTETFLRFRREVETDHPRCRRVETYAARLGCSVRTLTRACLSATGRTAKQVIDDRVALEAMRMLRCTDLPVAAVGQRLGFPGPTHFGRFFHREVGCTPGAFRAAGDGYALPAPAGGRQVPLAAS
ncbi:MAG TPA: helix-turn-helix domain-containing protein [Micromonosporaceae bacterium]|nr:helix-turn-helix domain-containing protein [Micromonosporaceae bacterium]